MTDAKRDRNQVPTLIAVSNGDGVTPVPLWADPVTHRLLVSGVLGMDVYNIKSYGAAVDGTTDDTAAVNAAIAAAQSAGGGTIFFPEGTTRINGAIVIARTLGHAAPGTLPYQTPLRFTGVGASWNGYWTAISLPPTGSVLDMRFSGDGGTHLAKIDTRGAGILEIDHLVIKSGGSDNFPMIRTTNTTVFIHHNAFTGNPANSGTSCAQDAIILGGDGTGAAQSEEAEAMFQGYGSKIHDNFYEKIRRCITFQSECNGIEVENETVSKICGSSETLGAPFYFTGGTGCRIKGGTIEVTNYKYAVSFNSVSDTFIDSLGVYDNTGYTVSPIYCSAGSNYNVVFQGYCDTAFQEFSTYFTGPGYATSSLFSGSRFGLTRLSQGFVTSTVSCTSFSTVRADLPLGTNMVIDTGTGGSYLDTKAYSDRFYDQSGNLKAEIMPGKAGGAIRPGSGVTGSRPSAVTAGAGAIWFDTTLNKLIVSNGTTWEVITSV